MIEVLKSNLSIGIFTWIISWLIVYFITSYISRKRWNKIYFEKVKNANYEFIQSIKPMVIENKYSNKNFIKSISNSISNKYDVNKEDLISINSIIDSIVLEISQSYFLDSKQKELHIEDLLKLKQEKERLGKNTEKIIIKDKNFNSQTSFLLATLTFSYTLVFSFFLFKENSSYFYANEIFQLFPLLIITIIPIALTLLIQIKKTFFEKEKLNDLKSHNNDNYDILLNTFFKKYIEKDKKIK